MKWYVWLSIWLSLCFGVFSCGTPKEMSRPLEAAAAVSPVPFPKVSDDQEIHATQRRLTEEHSATVRASRSAPRSTTTTIRLRASTTTTEAVRKLPATTTTTAVAQSEPEGQWNIAQASFYGPGLYGHGTACGQRMTPNLVGVAHKSLPCGTMVTFEHNGIVVTVPVVDRGPFVKGRIWDLTTAACKSLGHCYTGPIHWRL